MKRVTNENCIRILLNIQIHEFENKYLPRGNQTEIKVRNHCKKNIIHPNYIIFRTK